MSTTHEQPSQPRIDEAVAREAAFWAKLVSTLKVGEVSAKHSTERHWLAGRR
jgi:hypothetical protein